MHISKREPWPLGADAEITFEVIGPRSIQSLLSTRSRSGMSASKARHALRQMPTVWITYHLNVADPEAWYRQNHPALEPGDIVAGKCFYCWQELSVGDTVVVRSKSEIRGTRPAARTNHTNRIWRRRLTLSCRRTPIQALALPEPSLSTVGER